MRSAILPLALFTLAACDGKSDDTGSTTDGGSTDGGATDGGSADGGAGDGGAGDGGGDGGAEVDTDGDGTPDSEDCEPENADVYPGADEVCNEVDDDCDGDVDEEPTDGVTSYVDADGDGFGDPATEVTVCEGASGYTTNGLDCDDTNSDVNPGVVEVCDGIDNDCGDDGDDGAVSIGTKGYGSIQAALDAAVADDTITICPGTYLENLEVSTTVALVAFDTDAETIVDGSAAGPVISLLGADISMTGLTITNGKGGSAGGGIDGSLYEGGDVTLDSCVITDNSAAVGGAVSMGEGALVATNTEFSDNSATASGGAIRLPESATAELASCTISGNSARDGGAINADGGLSLEDTTVSDNSASNSGGGIVATGGLTIAGETVISDNSAVTGGGVYAADCDVVMDEDASIETNTASSEGGGVYLYASDGGTATWTGGTLSENFSDSLGGGMLVQVEEDGEGSVVVEGVTADGNEGDWSGGGFWLAGTTVELIDSVATTNISTYGGGASINLTEGIYLEGVTITDNEASSGGGAFDVYRRPGTLTECVIERNVSYTSTGGDGLGGAVYIPTLAYLTSDDTDWGEGTDDNEPDDIYMEYKATTYDSFGSGESFYCDGDDGTCE